MRARAQEREQLGGRRSEEKGGGIFEGEGKKRKPWYHTTWCGAPADDLLAPRDRINKFIEKIIF